MPNLQQLDRVRTVRRNYTSAQTNAAVIAAVAGTRYAVTRVLVTADKANTVNVAVRLGFHATVTPTTDDVVAAHPGIEPGSGFNSGDGEGVLGVGALGAALLITSGAPTTGSIDVTVTYLALPA